jgi:hypothetical protein
MGFVNLLRNKSQHCVREQIELLHVGGHLEEAVSAEGLVGD